VKRCEIYFDRMLGASLPHSKGKESSVGYYKTLTQMIQINANFHLVMHFLPPQQLEDCGMAYTRQHFYSDITTLPKGVVGAILALLILAIIGLTPMLGSALKHAGAKNAVVSVMSEPLQGTGEFVGSGTKCAIHTVCIAIVTNSPITTPVEYIGAKHRLSLQSSVLLATGPPLLQPPIVI